MVGLGPRIIWCTPGWRNGRRDGLKIRWAQARVGSNPTPGTEHLPVRVLLGLERLDDTTVGSEWQMSTPTNWPAAPIR